MTLTPVRIQGPAGTLAGWTAGPAEPTAPPLVLIHPINTRGLIWADVAEILAGDRTVLMPDLRAHGDSAATGEFGLDPWTDDVEAFMDAAGVDGPFHVAGGSLGGSLAVCLAARRPDRVLSVTGMGSALYFPGLDPEGSTAMFTELGVAGAFRAAFSGGGTFGPDVDPELVERSIALANPNDVDTVVRVWKATVTSDSRERAAGLDLPALVITGEHDATCTPALGLEMARSLRTEQLIMPGLGHLPMLERPQRIAALLGRLLAEAEEAASLRSAAGQS
jgi:pimeloyl-ACP methyl ester carboxylesterase